MLPKRQISLLVLQNTIQPFYTNTQVSRKHVKCSGFGIIMKMKLISLNLSHSPRVPSKNVLNETQD